MSPDRRMAHATGPQVETAIETDWGSVKVR
jgi:hypothetical protein